MFSIGEKVVYPTQGLGVVEKIENKVFSGVNREYTVIRILSNNMDVMIPSDKIDDSNIRKVSDKSTLENILTELVGKSVAEQNPKERYQSNVQKFKSGFLKDNAEIVYDLVKANQIKPLNSSEKKLYTSAHKLLVEEVSAIKDISTNEAKEFLHLDLN